MAQRLRGRPGQRQRERRLIAASHTCAKCGRYADRVDHIVPLAKGGQDVDANIRCLCVECHRKVTAEQFGFKRKVAVSLDGWPLED